MLPLPAHHRPPQIEFRHGVPYYFTVGQLPDPQQIVAQLPERGGMSDAQRDFFVLHIVLLFVVAVVLCGCVCAVVVICGGTLMGIIGVVGQHLPLLAVTGIGVCVAVGWAASRIRGGGRS